MTRHQPHHRLPRGQAIACSGAQAPTGCVQVSPNFSNRPPAFQQYCSVTFLDTGASINSARLKTDNRPTLAGFRGPFGRRSVGSARIWRHASDFYSSIVETTRAITSLICARGVHQSFLINAEPGATEQPRRAIPACPRLCDRQSRSRCSRLRRGIGSDTLVAHKAGQ